MRSLIDIGNAPFRGALFYGNDLVFVSNQISIAILQRVQHSYPSNKQCSAR